MPTEDGDDFSDFGSSQPSDSVPASAQVPAEPEVQSTAMPTVASFSSSAAAPESDEFSDVSPAKACLSSSFSEPAAPPPAPKDKEDDGFGDFEAPPAPAAPKDKEDDGFGDFEAPPAPSAPKDKEDDGFGDFADAPARAVGQTREDDDGFGGFAVANTPASSAVKADDVRKRDHSQPACECNLSLCVARLHSQDFGDFDAGGSATDFSSAPAPVPLPAVPTPAPTAPGLVPADVMDGPDPTALKLAAADALLHVLPTSAQLQSTGMTGCPTLDQMLSQQVRPPPKECACACHDLVRLAFRVHHRWDSQESRLGIRRFGRPSSRHRTLGRGRTLFSSRAFCRHSERRESKIPHLPVQK